MIGNKNLQLIQALRGVASLLVVFYHTTVNANEVLKNNFLFNFFNFGGAGVDIFFVLSGFIISYTSLAIISKKNKLFTFLRRRFIRIFPVYWIIISLFLVVQILLPAFYKTHFPFTIQNILSTFLLLPAHIMVNGVSWTLTYELFFYLIFSFVFIINNKKSAFILGAVYSLIIIILALSGYNYKNENTWMSVITNPMNVEFFLGVLCLVIIPFFPKKLIIPVIITGAVVFVINGVIFNSGYQLVSNNFNRVILFGIPSFFIITGAIKYELTRNISVPGYFLKLGDASYSLYLLHLPLLAACCKIISILKIDNSILQHILLLIIITGISIGSILFYQFCEKPVINKLNKLKRIKVESEI